MHIIYVTGMRYIFPFFLKWWICAILLFLSSKMHFQIHLCIIIPFEKRFLFFQEHWNRRPFMVKSTIKHLIADVTDTWWRMLHYQIIFAPQKTLKIKVITNAKSRIFLLWENCFKDSELIIVVIQSNSKVHWLTLKNYSLLKIMISDSLSANSKSMKILNL